MCCNFMTREVKVGLVSKGGIFRIGVDAISEGLNSRNDKTCGYYYLITSVCATVLLDLPVHSLSRNVPFAVHRRSCS